MKNTPFANLPFSKNTHSIIAVERALSDIRHGVPVVLVDNPENTVLIAATESIGQEELDGLKAVSCGLVSLVIAQKRVRFLFPECSLKGHIQGENNAWTLELLQSLGGMIPCDIKSASTPEIQSCFTDAEKIAEVALDLVKLAELLPSVVMVKLGSDGIGYAAENNVLALPTKDVLQYKEIATLELKEVCRAPLQLHDAKDSTIIAFRSSGNNREHYALIIGNPDTDNPLVRVHSSCYTGDLLGSLHCDCGDQFRTAIHFMAEHQGGIILYLMQEGRGIGLTNKLRTYGLQAAGFDTVDANEILGFDDDERLFLPAAKILELLGISKINLLTNNPRKAKGLEECGIKVTACVPHIMPVQQHNEAYLKTKADRLGHILPAL